MTALLQRLRQTPLAQRLRLILPARPHTIAAGVGAGLSFDLAGADPSYVRGQNEQPVQEAIAEHTRADMVFYDIGANIGFFTVLAASLVGPSGHVYAFEPVETNVAAINRNVRLNHFSNVTVLPVAVTERSGHAALTLARHIGGAALAEAGAPPDATKTITIETIALDDIVRRGRARPPHVVKIDVEGAELQVLRGMAHVIAEHKPVIIFEVDAAEQEHLQRKRRACLDFLVERGYKITDLAESYADIDWQVAHSVAVPVESRGDSATY